MSEGTGYVRNLPTVRIGRVAQGQGAAPPSRNFDPDASLDPSLRPATCFGLSVRPTASRVRDCFFRGAAGLPVRDPGSSGPACTHMRSARGSGYARALRVRILQRCGSGRGLHCVCRHALIQKCLQTAFVPYTFLLLAGPATKGSNQMAQCWISFSAN